MVKRSIRLSAALILMTSMTRCADPPPVASLCSDIHPISGLGDAALKALSQEKKDEIEGQNCKIEKACGYKPDKACPKV